MGFAYPKLASKEYRNPSPLDEPTDQRFEEQLKILKLKPLRMDNNHDHKVLDIPVNFGPTQASARIVVNQREFNRIVSDVLLDSQLSARIVSYWLSYLKFYQNNLSDDELPARDHHASFLRKCDSNDPNRAEVISAFLSEKIESNVLALIIERDAPNWGKNFSVEWIAGK